MNEDFLSDQKLRAEDILLGSLGFGEEAKLLEIRIENNRYFGKGAFPDGENFDFESEGGLSAAEIWALRVLVPNQALEA